FIPLEPCRISAEDDELELVLVPGLGHGHLPVRTARSGSFPRCRPGHAAFRGLSSERCLAGPPGFEPGLTDPESVGLPLPHGPVRDLGHGGKTNSAQSPRSHPVLHAPPKVREHVRALSDATIALFSRAANSSSSL